MEGNGLLDVLHTLHCGAITDLNTGEEFYYGPAIPLDFDWLGLDPSPEEKLLLANPTGSVPDCVEALSEAALTVAHNGVGYDYLAIEKLYPDFKRCPKPWDSMIAAKAVWPADALADKDFALARAGSMPMFLVKRHSLKAWGYRLGEYKDEYGGDLRIADPEQRKAVMWEQWNPWMSSYMMQDNRPGVKLWHLIEKRIGWRDPTPDTVVWPELVMEMEHEVARILAEQEAFGVRFGVERAQILSAELSNEKARIEKQLKDAFGSWWQRGKEHTEGRDVQYKRPEFPDVTLRRVSEKTGKELKPYVGPPLEHRFEGATSTPIVWTTFNPSSRDHLGMRLQDVFGWKPKKHGANGKPTVDESVLEEIPEAVIPKALRQLILDYFVVNKTLGMLAKGSKAWLNVVKDDGRIHGRVDSLGTVTGRGAHSSPNLGQCPAVRKKKVKDELLGTVSEVVMYGLEGRYGAECRALFVADVGWEQTGVDASALELIDLGHYLQPHDGGKFSDRVCDPKRDPHTEHAELTGLTRGDTKTATYLYVYGGSAYKLSLDLSITPEEIPEHLSYRGLPALLRSLAKRFDDDFVAKLDDSQRAKIAKARKIILAFEAGIDGIKDLKDGVQAAAKRGWLRGMDGRKLYVRAAHAALNTLLQSAGAQSCKLWMVLTHRKLKALGLKSGVDFKQILWIHDECQFTHRPGLGPIIRDVAEEAMREAGEMLGLRGVYRTDGKTGANWFECH